MTTSKVLATTTPSLDGWEIEAYLGPVFSHIVAGTGFFSDFAASFSDVFGGRSETYQRQLSAINSEAIELLKRKSALLGANLILGLRIDHDEISGKAKQMFMVTASGTAARGIQRNAHNASKQKSTILTSDALQLALKKKSIIDKSKLLPISFTDDEWSFITQNQVTEIASQVLQSLQLMVEQQPGPFREGYLAKTKNYFQNLPAQEAVVALYGHLEKHASLFNTFIRDTIIRNELFDFEALFSLFKSEQLNTQKWALALSQANKPYYTPEDMTSFSKLVNIIESTFVVRAQFVEEKGTFSSTVKAKWVCECGHKNDKDKPRCSACLKDVYGFTEDELQPVKATEVIKQKIAVLEELFR